MTTALTLEIIDDLVAEGGSLDTLVTDLGPDGWRRDTPSPGWSVAHQIAHLAWTDQIALDASAGEAAFADAIGRLAAYGADVTDRTAAAGAVDAGPVLLGRWRAGRARLATVLRDLPDGTRLPWFGPPMRAASMATARLMETWAHGTDVAEALGVTREPTARLRHIAHLGWRTRGFSYAAHGLPVPESPVRVVLTAPDGTLWEYGPHDAPETVSGPAEDFCLLVTQRRHLDDLDLTASGPESARWLGIAQAFAGPSGGGRAPRGER